MTKLLTEQELSTKILQIEKLSSTRTERVLAVIDLIQSQKLAHADMVIGEDDKEGFIAVDGRNRLRAVQRERNK